MSSITRKRAAQIVGTLWTGIALLCQAQSAPSGAFLDTKIEHFEMVDKTLSESLGKLSMDPQFMAISFEEVLRDRQSDPPLREPRGSIRLENKTVREIMDAVCDLDNRYTWTSDAGILNVYPKATVGDSSYLLNLSLDRLDLVDVADADDALTPIARKLPTEQIGYAQMGGGVRYEKSWTVTFESLTVRQALNRIAAHLGPRGGWTFTGSREQRLFSFHRYDFSTAH